MSYEIKNDEIRKLILKNPLVSASFAVGHADEASYKQTLEETVLNLAAENERLHAEREMVNKESEIYVPVEDFEEFKYKLRAVLSGVLDDEELKEI